MIITDVLEWLESWIISHPPNNKKKGGGGEKDIYMPDKCILYRKSTSIWHFEQCNQ